jgi:hypothetical protein
LKDRAGKSVCRSSLIFIKPFRRSHIFAVAGGMMVVSGDVATKVELLGAHGLSALIPRRRDGRCFRFAIGLLFSEDPVRRFGQMSSDRADGLLMTLAPGDALVEATDVTPRRAAAVEADCVGGFDEGPLEVAIDVWAGWPEASRVFPPLAWTRGVVPA